MSYLSLILFIRIIIDLSQRRLTISITEKTFQKLDKFCGDLIPHSRYIESILVKEFSKGDKK